MLFGQNNIKCNNNIYINSDTLETDIDAVNDDWNMKNGRENNNNEESQSLNSA